MLRHVLDVLRNAARVPCSLVVGTHLEKLCDGAIMAHDHDCDLLLVATDAAQILELTADVEGDGWH